MLTSILSVLTLLMPVITFLMNIFRIKKENQEKFIQLIQKSKDDGKISIEARDEFRRQDEILSKPEEPPAP